MIGWLFISFFAMLFLGVPIAACLGLAALIALVATGSGVNLIIAACMCEGELTRAILMNLADLIESVGITDEEFEQLIYQIRLETEENIISMEKHYQEILY